ncbi:hypothetical protein [Pseudoalteromonas sp. Of11M-6]|uniref:hypothetical protein n=1 Tax=Pseudoalteromonas sp. Of11M-6 TaxID=2917754 RepID=UPI001EF6109A|nr:hypothetical protein [Pseudoalteromonas sp. Of11M-6]MCG7552088.1 hypothetical protein [Pseudoalteromonas sp. Of11M-6]
MSKVIKEKCLLCSEPSTYVETDHGNRRHYICSGVECGEYEVSLSAIKRVSQNEVSKMDLTHLTKEAKSKGLLLEIIVGSNNEIELKAIEKA